MGVIMAEVEAKQEQEKTGGRTRRQEQQAGAAISGR
jgi:hypothetical protein